MDFGLLFSILPGLQFNTVVALLFMAIHISLYNIIKPQKVFLMFSIMYSINSPRKFPFMFTHILNTSKIETGISEVFVVHIWIMKNPCASVLKIQTLQYLHLTQPIYVLNTTQFVNTFSLWLTMKWDNVCAYLPLSNLNKALDHLQSGIQY